ncbi:MAG: ComF family protein [Candidatus Berkelbacteria bacterium]
MEFIGIKNQIISVGYFFLDLIFPKKCVNCGEFGSFCCQKCLEKIKSIETQVCPKCGKISDRGKWCASCKGKSNLSGIIVGAQYRTGPTKELIHHLKYNFILDLSPILADLLIDQLIDIDLRGDIIVTSVPLHRRRQNERGFNQAEVLAKIVAKKVGYNYLPLLKRKIHKKTQVELSGVQRRENLAGIFDPADVKNIVGKTIILIDDVSTTGTTLEECAKVLRENGAKQVWGLVAARG